MVIKNNWEEINLQKIDEFVNNGILIPVPGKNDGSSKERRFKFNNSYHIFNLNDTVIVEIDKIIGEITSI